MDDESSSSDENLDVSDDEFDQRKFAPYQFEPEITGQVNQEENLQGGNAIDGRIGKIHWCVCS